MKIRLFYLSLALLVAGCSKDSQADGGAVTTDARVLLSVNSLQKHGGTRAAVDKWEDTEVGLAYRTTSPLYTEHLTVTIETEADQVVDMGMEYPTDGTPVYVRGFHPSQAPQASGLVTYDVSKGDIDLMCSNEVSGTQTSTIISGGNKLQFKHLMTRLTFDLRCADGQTYPERIAGVLISGAVSTQKLRTYASLDLATGSVHYTIPGVVYVGHPDGYYIPASYETDIELVLDAIVQPGVPLSVTLITMSDEEKTVAFNALSTLTTTGGEAGKQYKIKLTFNGTSILGDVTSVTEWTDGDPMPDQPNGGSGAWW